jgi:voltage-gated potassium channel
MKDRINKLRNLVETTDTRTGVFFDLIIQFLIVVSIIVFSMETLPNLNKDTSQTLYHIEFVLVIIFCAEYAIRFLVAEKNYHLFYHFGGL